MDNVVWGIVMVCVGALGYVGAYFTRIALVARANAQLARQRRLEMLIQFREDVQDMAALGGEFHRLPAFPPETLEARQRGREDAKTSIRLIATRYAQKPPEA